MHIQDPEQREWIQAKIEVGYAKTTREEQLRILRRLNAAEAFETFLQTKFVGQKRFSLEGGESVIALLDRILSRAAEDELDEVCIGMPHRGRLNVLANIAGKSYGQIFREFEGKQDPRSVQGSGDVKYHLGTEGEFTAETGATTKVYLAANPAHLEAVNPVLEGIVRAKQDRLNLAGEDFTVLPVLLHGDAAFAGQGVVAETLNLSQLRGYRTGGTVHVVINNQVGFTTSPSSSRSSTYSTDVARMIQAPIFHVNGDDPEACVRVAEIAYEFRKEFHKDVVLDMVCYRRRGHNEGDDPSMTQPLMYNLIEAKRSVRKLYTESLIGRGDITVEDAEAALRDYQQQLERVFVETKEALKSADSGADNAYTGTDLAGHSGLEPPRAQSSDADATTHSATDTAVSEEVLERIATAFVSPPKGFTVHPKLKQMLDKRAASIRQGGIDWGTAELLAFGSLLIDGTPVRLAGQDSRRGTFVSRHAVLIDKENAAEWTPLLYLGEGQAKFWIYDSLLSEFAAMGFEYGYSVERPDALVLWEAQFGDFFNGGQTIVDEFISSSRAEVGTALLRGAAPPPRLRGPGARPLLGPDRALPHHVRRRQHDRRLPLDAGVVLPPAAPPGVLPAEASTHRLHPQVDAPAQGCQQLARGLHERDVPPRPPRPPERHGHHRDPGAHRGRQGRLRPGGGAARSARTRRRRSCAWSSTTRCPLPTSPRRSRTTPTPRWWSSRTSRATWGRGRSSPSTSPRRWPHRASTAACRVVAREPLRLAGDGVDEEAPERAGRARCPRLRPMSTPHG